VNAALTGVVDVEWPLSATPAFISVADDGDGSRTLPGFSRAASRALALAVGSKITARC
jgi:hypothetical protein